MARWEHDGQSPWTRTEMLLAMIADLLAGANWQRGGGKGARPKPIPRPGVGPEITRIGGRASYAPAEMRALIDRHSRGITTKP